MHRVILATAVFGAFGLLGCPTPSSDGDPTPEGPPGETPDGGTSGDAGCSDAGCAGPSDAGDPADTGGGSPLDGGEADAGTDAGPVDGGFVCIFPDIEPPPPRGDAGAEDCPLSSAGAVGDFSGTWEGRVFGIFPLFGSFDLPAAGDVDFSVYCSGDKLLIDGLLEGVANEGDPSQPDGYPFEGRVYGEFDLNTGAADMVVNPATLHLGPFLGTFQVHMTGRRTDDEFQDGQWCGNTVDPPGGHGEGSWTASLR